MDTSARLTNPIMHYGILVLIYGVGLITLLSHTLLHSGHSHSATASTAPAITVSCTTTSQTHTITIQHDQAVPQTTEGKLCDKITFVNHDNTTREMAFGPHEDHVPYDGVSERVLGQNQSFTIILNQAGSFHFHDHAHDEVDGYFNVTK